jgi:hypothetical protein
MNKGNINITVSGGSSDFGNIVQGDRNKISISQAKALQDFYSNISDLQKSQKITIDEIERLRLDVESVIQGYEGSDLIDKIKIIYDKYSWALEPLKKLFSIILP